MVQPGPPTQPEPQAAGPSTPPEPQAAGPSTPPVPQAAGPSTPPEPQAAGPQIQPPGAHAPTAPAVGGSGPPRSLLARLRLFLYRTTLGRTRRDKNEV